MTPMEEVVTVGDGESATPSVPMRPRRGAEQTADPRAGPPKGGPARARPTRPTSPPETGAPTGVEAEAATPVEVRSTHGGEAGLHGPRSPGRLRTKISGKSLQPSLSRGSSHPRALRLPGELPQRRVVVIDENPEIDIQAAREKPPPASPELSEPQEGMTDIGATLDDERGRKRRWRMFRKGGD